MLVQLFSATVWMLGVFGSIFTFALGVSVPNTQSRCRFFVVLIDALLFGRLSDVGGRCL